MNGPDACVLWLMLQQPKKLGHPPRRFIHPGAAGRTIVSQQLLRPALLHESMWQVTSRSFVNDANAACGKVSFKGAVAAAAGLGWAEWAQVLQVPSVCARIFTHAIAIRPRGNVLSSASHYAEVLEPDIAVGRGLSRRNCRLELDKRHKQVN